MTELGDLLTVIIPVYNEEVNLPLCLDTLKEIKHKVVVDSDSTDRTKEIAEQYGCQYMNFKWDGHPPKKRTWAMHNCGVKTPWVFFMDADERFTPAVKEELRRVLPGTKHDKFWMTYNNWFMGRILRHGEPSRKDYLIRYGAAEFERIEEDRWSKLPIEMHEHLITKGTSGVIWSPIEHYDRRPLSNYYAKHCDYADFEANRCVSIKDWSVLTRREKIKYGCLRNKLLPFVYFIYVYLFKGGFLDGAPGFYFAFNKLSQLYQIQAKIFELEFKHEEVL